MQVAFKEAIDPNDRLELSHCEQGVIGGAITNPHLLDSIDTGLRGEHFFDDELGKLYDAMVDLHRTGVNIQVVSGLGTLIKTMKRDVKIKPSELAKWSNDYGWSNFRYYADAVITAWRHRQLWLLGSELSRRFNFASGVAVKQNDRDDIAFIERRIATIYETRDTYAVQSAYDIATEYLDELEKPVEGHTGIFTGIPCVDQAIGKTLPGELMVIAARTGCGKTALALQIAEHNAANGTVFFVSLEMKNHELISRTLCRMAGVDSHAIRNRTTGEYGFSSTVKTLRDMSKSIRGMPLFVWAPPKATIQQINSKTKYVKAAHGLSLIVVDYIGIVESSGESRRDDRYLQIGEITRALKSMAKEYNVPVIALAQLKRDDTNRRPEVSALRESGNIEQDADIVLMIHHERDQDSKSITESMVIVGKHRHSVTGVIPVDWNPTLTSFGGQIRKPVNYVSDFDTFGA